MQQLKICNKNITNIFEIVLQYLCVQYQDTRSCVSSQESRVTHKCVIYRNRWLPVFNLSYLTRPICIKFVYFIPSIYAILHTKFEKHQLSNLCDMCWWKLPLFFTFFFFAPFYKSNFEPTKDTLLIDRFISNLAHLLCTLWPIIT